MSWNTDIKNHLNTFTIVLLIVAACLINIPIIETLWRHSFDDGTYSHAYLIPFICFYLLLEVSKENAIQARNNISISFLVLLCLFGYGMFVFSTAQFAYGYWLFFLAVTILACFCLFEFSKRLLFSLSFLIFIFPVWGVLVAPLQNLSTIVVTQIMRMTQIPTFVEEQFIHIPSGTFEIAGGCSGLRYFITALAISSLYIFFYIRDAKKGGLFLSIAIIGALVTNWIRITLLIIIGHQTEMTSPLMEDHNSFGWYIFAPFMILLFLVGGKLSDQNTAAKPKRIENKQQNNLQKCNIAVTAIILVISSRLLTMPSVEDEVTQLTNIDNSIAPEIAFFTRVNLTKTDDHSYKLIYEFDSNNLDEKPLYYLNNVVPEGWLVTNTKKLDEWQEFEIVKDGQVAIIKVSYEIDGLMTGNVKEFKKLRLIKALVGTSKTKMHWQLVSTS